MREEGGSASRAPGQRTPRTPRHRLRMRAQSCLPPPWHSPLSFSTSDTGPRTSDSGRCFWSLVTCHSSPPSCPLAGCLIQCGAKRLGVRAARRRFCPPSLSLGFRDHHPLRRSPSMPVLRHPCFRIPRRRRAARTPRRCARCRREVIVNRNSGGCRAGKAVDLRDRPATRLLRVPVGLPTNQA